MRPGMQWFAVVFVAVAAVAATAVIIVRAKEPSAATKSLFGKYQGYSEATYDGNERMSNYLTLSDGTRLAYDLILPSKNGVPAAEPLPVLFKYTIYLRAITT